MLPQKRRYSHKCDHCYNPEKKNYIRSIYPDKMQAMQGQYGHLNNCKQYTRQKQDRNVLTNQFPVVENGPFQAMMQMEEYLDMYAPDEAGRDGARNVAGMDEAEGNDRDRDIAGMDEAEGNENEKDDEAGRDTARDIAEMDEAEGNENEAGIHFQNLLLENLYNYFGHARQRRPNRSKEDIEAGKTANFVNNRTLARLFCYATEWQLPAEGLFTLFNYIISIVHNNKLDFSNGRFVVNVRFNNKGRSKRTISSKA